MQENKWGSYPETLLVFPTEPEIVIDLRMEVSLAVRESLAAIGLDRPFGIVTAFNPRGDALRAEENTQRMKDLENELNVGGHQFTRVDGCSIERTHCERSVAAKMKREDVVALARKYEQLAIFWWDGEQFWIDGALIDGSEKLPIPR